MINEWGPAVLVCLTVVVGIITNNKRLDDVNKRLDEIIKRLDRIEAKLDNHDSRIAVLRRTHGLGQAVTTAKLGIRLTGCPGSSASRSVGW